MASAAESLARASNAPERQDLDYRLEDFVLDPEGTARRFRHGRGDVDIGQAVTDTSLALTTEGASTIEITILDRGLRLLRSDLLTGWAWGTNADERDEKHWIKDGRAVDAK